MIRSLGAVLAVGAAALLVIGLTFSAAVDAPAEFRFSNGTEPKTLDPHHLTGQPGGRIVMALFEGLTRFDGRSLQTAPGLAERWEISPDGRRYVFQLRDDARWSNGRPVTAEDFVWSWRRLLEPATAAEYAYLLHGVRYAKAFHQPEAAGPQAAAEARRRFGVDAGVFARDERSLVVELVAPLPYFLDLLAFYPTFAVPREAIEAEGRAADWFLPGSIVTNGPFELESWRVNDRIRLVRSEHYWGRSEVALASVDALPIENETAALNLFLTGELDWVPNAYPKDLGPLLRGRDFFYASPQLGTYYYSVNCTRPPFDDRRVRRALALAIDRELITREVTALGELPAAHFVPPGIAGYEPPPSALAFAPDEARRLLADAGFPGGRGFPAFGILYNTLDVHKKIAEVVADGWRRELGIAVSAYNQEWQSYLATMRQLDYDLARRGWIGDYADPNTFLDLWVSGGGNNQTGFSDPLYDRLIEAAADVEALARDGQGAPAWFAQLAEPERARKRLAALHSAREASRRRESGAQLRMHFLREAEAILVNRELPILPIYTYVASGLLNPRVRGFTIQTTGPNGQPIYALQDWHPLRELSLAGADDGPSAPASRSPRGLRWFAAGPAAASGTFAGSIR